MKNLYLLSGIIMLGGCTADSGPSAEEIIANAREEVLATEAAFDAMAADKGLKEAFVTFAAEDASLIRGNQIIEGKAAIEEYMSRPSPYTNVKLTWKPDFVDVASSGDLGHTWGHYTFTALDSLGESVESTGIFRTVWKKQADGTWKYVLD